MTNEPINWSSAVLDERIRKYLQKCPAAVSGHNGHDAIFRLACVLVRGIALPLERALFCLRIYNQKCDPPWTKAELVHKAKSVLQVTHRKHIGHLL
jgi:hypothetical protein